MNRSSSLLALMFVLASLVTIPALLDSAVAETQTSDIAPIGSNMGIEKSTIQFSVPENNSMPWAFVRGTVNNAVPQYPVIIQIYSDDVLVKGNTVGGIHFAQTDVNEDGTYEYRFRATDTSNDSKINIFEGDYTVKIFKVVYLNDNLNAI